MQDKPKVILDSAWRSFIIVIIVLIIFIIGYAVLHIIVPGSVDRKLSDEDKTAVTLILNDTSSRSNRDAKIDSAVNYIIQRLEPINNSIKTEFINEYSYLNITGFLVILSSISISSPSYFWLNTDYKYLEVIFWSIFGVIANLLYFASEAMRKRNFNVKELPVYFAKIFYTPFIVLILILSYKQLTASGEIQFDDTSVEIIIFSFILGFFSGRAIELLNKIKDILLPGVSKESRSNRDKIMLTGKVIAPKEKASSRRENIEVSAVSSVDENKFFKTVTNEDGVFCFDNLDEGIYNLIAETFLDDEKFSAAILNKKLSADKPVEVENLELIKEN